MLLLFDIDATLIRTLGLGIKSMGIAGRELFGPGFDEKKVEYAGRLDPLIMRDLLDVHGQPSGPDAIADFRAAYRKHLQTQLAESTNCHTCPGVPALLAALRPLPGITLGLLTGNFAETGTLKLRACGVDPDQFSIRVWGDESPVKHPESPARSHLPPVAMGRYQQMFGKAIEPRRVTIIGDTPGDIGCARDNGCRSLGVATGHFSVKQLMECGADCAVEDLSDTHEILRWLTQA